MNNCVDFTPLDNLMKIFVCSYTIPMVYLGRMILTEYLENRYTLLVGHSLLCSCKSYFHICPFLKHPRNWIASPNYFKFLKCYFGQPMKLLFPDSILFRYSYSILFGHFPYIS